MPSYKDGGGQFDMSYREMRDETWGNPSYGYSKTGLTPEDIAEEKARRAAEHEADSEANN